MRIPYKWLNEYLNTTKSPEELAEILTLGGLEVEEIQDWTLPDGSETDRVLLTKVTANRGDLLSMIGVARHAAALIGIDADTSVAKKCALGDPVSGFPQVTAGSVVVEIADADACPRYSALLIEGIQVGPSPDWLANRLLAAGMRPISNVVDCTNYVLWELGQPLHAFDFDLLARVGQASSPAMMAEGTAMAGETPAPRGIEPPAPREPRAIIVRKAAEGETIVTIDDQERKLLSSDLLITDPSGPVALAGVMGGANSEMNANTTRVLLESAHFDPSTIRKTALRLGMSSEASYRFERHVDPNLTLIALSRVAELILETAGGSIAGPVIDVKAQDFEPKVIDLRPARCNALLGTDLSPTQMALYLESIDFGVEHAASLSPSPFMERAVAAAGGRGGEVPSAAERGSGGEVPCGPGGEVLRVTVPTVRPDIEREVDLIEEVAIIHGYNQIPMTIPGKLPGSAVLTDRQKLERRARTILRGCGLNETLGFSMMCQKDLDRLGLPADAPERTTLKLASPMIAEQSEMRTTLLPGLLAACETNVRQRIADVALYEINPVFIPVGGQELPREEKRVAGIIMGTGWTSNWNLKGEQAKVDFYWLKGIVEQLLDGLNVGETTFAPATHPTFAVGRCAAVRLSGTVAMSAMAGETPAPRDAVLGHLGEIAPPVQSAYDLPGNTYAFELNLDALLAAACLLRGHSPLPRFPAALRDLALVVSDDEAHSAAQIAAAMRTVGGELLQSVRPFDLYRDEKRLGAGRKSLAFSLEFRSPDRTLTDEEVEAAIAAIVAHLEASLGAEVRKA